MTETRAKADDIRATADQLRRYLVASGVFITGDDRVSEQDVVKVLGYDLESWRKMRSLGTAPRVFYCGTGKGSRHSYRITEVAEWIHRERN